MVPAPMPLKPPKMPNASWSWMIQVKATTRRIPQPEKEQNPFSRRKRSLSLRRLSYLRAASQSLSSALTCPLKMLEEFFSFWSSVRNLERCLLCTLVFFFNIGSVCYMLFSNAYDLLNRLLAWEEGNLNLLWVRLYPRETQGAMSILPSPKW